MDKSIATQHRQAVFEPPAAHRQRERLQALYRLAAEVASLRDLQGVLDTALRHCLALTESQFGFIGLNTPDNAAMDVAAIQGFDAAPDFYQRFHLIPLRPSIFARAVLENRPVRSDDAATDPTRVGQPRGHPPVRTFLGVPLRLAERVAGMIGVANRPGRYHPEDEELLSAYASHVAMAIQNARLYEELKAAKTDLEAQVAARTSELAEAKEALAQKAKQLQRLLVETVSIQEQERERIAHDMHDGVNQLIIGAMFEVKAARERLQAGQPDAVERALGRVRSVLGQVDGELKRLIFDLRPPTLDALGLADSVGRYAERFHIYSGVECKVNISGPSQRLPPHVEIGIYRVMQEALNNVAHHARARRVLIDLAFGSWGVEFAVGDDGRGFDAPKARHGEHLGLLGMEERAARLGGQLTIVSAPGQGTTVTLHVPANLAASA